MKSEATPGFVIQIKHAPTNVNEIANLGIDAQQYLCEFVLIKPLSIFTLNQVAELNIALC